MAVINISDLTNFYIQKLQEKGKSVIVCKDWTEFANSAYYKSFVLLPWQTENKLWGVVYSEAGVNEVWWYSATPDPSKERSEIDRLIKQYCKTTAPVLTIRTDANSYSQSQKTNTDNNIEYSEAFANYMANKLVELQYNWHIANLPGNSFDNINFFKSTIESYRVGNYQNVKKVDKYDELFNYWGDNLRSDFNNKNIYLDGIKAIKPKLDQLTTNNQALQTEKDNLLGEWKIDFLKDFGDKLTIDSLKAVRAKLNQLATDLATANSKITTLEGDKAQLKNDVASRDTTISDQKNTINDKNIVIDKLKDLPDKIVALNTQLADKDIELGKRNDAITTLTSDKIKVEGERDQAKNDLVQANKDKSDLTTQLQNKDGELKTWTNTFGDKKPNEIKNQLDSASNSATALNQYWNDIISKDYADSKPLNDEGLKALHLKMLKDKTDIKILVGKQKQSLNKWLELAKEKVKQETKNFYSTTLSLDKSENIDPEYTKDYFILLDNLNENSNLEQVINAFKIVALIAMTKKYNEIFEEWNKKPTIPSAVKKTKLDTFNKIKNLWTENDKGNIQQDNNPLWIPLINDKENYKQKLNNIIEAWQTK